MYHEPFINPALLYGMLMILLVIHSIYPLNEFSLHKTPLVHVSHAFYESDKVKNIRFKIHFIPGDEVRCAACTLPSRSEFLFLFYP